MIKIRLPTSPSSPNLSVGGRCLGGAAPPASNPRPTEALDVVSSLLWFRSPLSLINSTTCRCGVCVAGDALHPMTPELGQDGCAVLEDGVVLARCLSDASGDVGGAGVDAERLAEVVGVVGELLVRWHREELRHRRCGTRPPRRRPRRG
jgi:2-polyprenyl-6-methoxyphenol hydroxylase-like FAD-dependent oxidoreductase